MIGFLRRRLPPQRVVPVSRRRLPCDRARRSPLFGNEDFLHCAAGCRADATLARCVTTGCYAPVAAVVGFRRSATAAFRCVVCVAGRRCLCDMVSSMTSAAPMPCAPLSPPRVRRARTPRLGQPSARAAC
jgi:hypothetical protein